MTIDQLRKAIKAEPFRPFTITVADGRQFPVQHREFVSVGPHAQRTFVVYNAASEDPEDYVILDLLLVTSLDFGGAPLRTNGPGGR